MDDLDLEDLDLREPLEGNRTSFCLNWGQADVAALTGAVQGQRSPEAAVSENRRGYEK